MDLADSIINKLTDEKRELQLQLEDARTQRDVLLECIQNCEAAFASAFRACRQIDADRRLANAVDPA